MTKQFGSFKAVNNITFDILTNQVTSILGHNGAGKSTLINMLCGILKPSSGTYKFMGQNAESTPAVLDGNIGYCAAFDVLYDSLTVFEYLKFVAELKQMEDCNAEILLLLKKFNLQEH